MHKLTSVMPTAGLLLLAGCSSVPNVTYNYYPAKWNAVATITQTIGCNNAKTRLVVLNTPTLTPYYSADFDKPFRISIKNLDSGFADSSMTMTFTEDGRLKTINQSTTGQGETIVKSAVSLMTTVAAITRLKATEGPLEECNIIETTGGGKPVTLNYRATIDAAALGKSIDFTATPESAKLYELLQNRLPKLQANVSNAIDNQSGPRYDAPSPATTSDNIVLLELQKTGSVTVTFDAGAATFGSTVIIIPEPGSYRLPIPKAALFGKQTFGITLSDAGAVTSISYGKETGTASALNSLNAAATPETTSATAASLKAQADLIAQQQRLVLCQTKPDQCK
ncbi:MAG: hypothetical protein P4L77_03970 [Sulfuriferula sp.]|nr:hypothetical protein [Sulfuriferula sp.]